MSAGALRLQHVLNDLGPGVAHGRTEMMYRDPDTYLRMLEQDRERMQTERALQRGAREGGEQRPGLDRGGSVSSRVFSARPARPRPTSAWAAPALATDPSNS